MSGKLINKNDNNQLISYVKESINSSNKNHLDNQIESTSNRIVEADMLNIFVKTIVSIYFDLIENYE